MNVHPHEASAATASPHRYGVEKVLPRLFACVPQPRPAATSGGVGGGDGAGDAGGLDGGHATSGGVAQPPSPSQLYSVLSHAPLPGCSGELGPDANVTKPDP